MRILYSLLTVLAAPVAFAALLLRGLRDRDYWKHLGERFGWGPRVAAPSLWLHAVSMGEVAAAAELVRALRTSHPDIPFVLTTATPTGRARAQALFGPGPGPGTGTGTGTGAGTGGVDVRFLPYDTPGSVRRFLDRTRPRIAVILETELWPNLIRSCRRRGIPVVLASARVTARSVSRYRRLGGLFRDAVRASTWIAAQSAEDAERFVALGADPQRTRVVGNAKFDMRLGASVLEQGRELRRVYLGSRPVWTAGSTHAGEEDLLLAAHRQLRLAIPDLLLVLVPRHPQRFEAVAALLKQLGVEFDRRTHANSVRKEAQVLLLDTMGELTAFYAAADAAFVGGSLVPVGGHNLLEPAALGVPVITGPYTANCSDIARPMLEGGGAVEAADGGALVDAARRLLQDSAAHARAVRAAQAFIEAHRGAVDRLTALIDPLIGPTTPAPGPPRAGNP